MSSSGGGGGATVAPTYIDPVNGMTFTDNMVNGSGPFSSINHRAVTGSGATALNAEIAQRQAQEKAASNAALDKTAANEAQSKADFQTRFDTAKNNALTGANQYFTQQGYDPARFATETANAISRSAGNVQDMSPNPGAEFSPSLGASVLADINSGYQNRAGNAVNGLFGQQYATNNVSDSWLNPAVQGALSSQFDPLSAQLTNAQKRGTLNSTGYDAALQALGNSRTAATSTISGLGQNILNSDRGQLNDYITGARNDAAHVNASSFDSFDPNSYLTGAQGMTSRFQDNFGGDLTNAIGSTSFSDLSSLLNAGGAVQGASDPTATNPASGPGGAGGPGISDAYLAQQALGKEQRGLGSQGAF